MEVNHLLRSLDLVVDVSSNKMGELVSLLFAKFC